MPLVSTKTEDLGRYLVVTMLTSFLFELMCPSEQLWSCRDVASIFYTVELLNWVTMTSKRCCEDCGWKLAPMLSRAINYMSIIFN